MSQQALSGPRTVASNVHGSHWPITVLLHRFVLFLGWQALIAGVHALLGNPNPWTASVAWWPVSVTLTNVVSFTLLRFLARREGIRWSELIHADFKHVGKDALALLGFLLVCAPVAMLPQLGLGQLLFGDTEAPLALFVQPLPSAVALATLFLFPVTQSFGELPTYFAYAMPRLAARWSNPRLAMLVAALWLGLQHATLPLIPDWRFILWRGLTFIPFAIALGITVRWRPRLLPYLMVIHAIIDFPVALMVWQASN